MFCLQRTIERRRRGGKGQRLQEMRRGAGFKTGDLVREKLGGNRRTARKSEPSEARPILRPARLRNTILQTVSCRMHRALERRSRAETARAASWVKSVVTTQKCKYSRWRTTVECLLLFARTSTCYVGRCWVTYQHERSLRRCGFNQVQGCCG